MLLLMPPASGELSVRIKDITTIAGEHPNDLIGLGVVVGLDGTGGTSEGTKRAAVEILQKLGLRADPQTRQLIQQAREKDRQYFDRDGYRSTATSRKARSTDGRDGGRLRRRRKSQRRHFAAYAFEGS